MSVTLDDKCPSYFTVNNLVARFRTWHLNTEDEDLSGRPIQVAIPENVNAIHSMILIDQRISAKKIAQTLAISRQGLGYVYYSQNFRHEKPFNQMGSQMSQCWS
jgi:hypothetical protein